MGDVCPAPERAQSGSLQHQFERLEGEIANVSGRPRTRVELDVVRRATEHQLRAAAERHEIWRRDRQPAAWHQYPRQLVDHGLRVEDVLDDFRGDNRLEALIAER